MKKRILSLALATVMLVTMFTACSSASGSTPAVSTPASSGSASESTSSGGMDTSPITISVMNRVPAEYIIENNHVLDEIERITGVHLEITAPPIANYNDRLQLVFFYV